VTRQVRDMFPNPLTSLEVDDEGETLLLALHDDSLLKTGSMVYPVL
jgi:hypothetical protein